MRDGSILFPDFLFTISLPTWILMISRVERRAYGIANNSDTRHRAIFLSEPGAFPFARAFGELTPFQFRANPGIRASTRDNKYPVIILKPGVKLLGSSEYKAVSIGQISN